MNKINIIENRIFSCENVLRIDMNAEESDLKRVFAQLEEERIRKSKMRIVWNKFDYNHGHLQSFLVMICDRTILVGGCDAFESLRIGPCLYVRHSCHPADLHFVYEKIGVYGYEHEIPLRRENITVFRSESEHLIDAEVFVPLDV